MAVRDVIVRLFGDDKDLRAKLDSADAKLSEFARSNPTAKLSVDDANASRILDDMKVKLTEYGKMTETARLRIDDAQALYTLDKLDLRLLMAKKSLDSLGKNMDLAGLAKARSMMDSIGQQVDRLGGGSSGNNIGFFRRMLGRGFGLPGGGGGGGGILSDAERTASGGGGGGGGVGSGLLSSVAGASNAYTGGAIAIGLSLLGSVAPALLPFLGGAGVGLGGAFLAGSLGASGAQKLQADHLALAQAQASLAGAKTGGSPSQRLALQQAQRQLAHDQGLYGGFAPFGRSVTGVGHSLLGSLLSAMTSRPVIKRGGTGPGTHGEILGQSFLGGLTGILGQVAGFIKTLGPGLGELFRASLPFVKAFVTIMEQFAKAVMPALTQMMKQFTPYLPQMVQGFKYITEGIVGFMKALGPGMKDAVTVFKALMIGVKGILIALGYIFTGLAYSYARLGHDFKRIGGEIVAGVRNMWHWLVTDSLSGWHKLKANEQRFLHDIAHEFDVFRHTVASIWDTIWNNTIGRFERGVNDAVRWVDSMKSRILGDLRSLPGQMVSIGVSIMEGLLHGLESMAGSILGWLGNFISSIPSKFMSLLGINSPSRVMAEIGSSIGEGLTLGMQKSSVTVHGTARSMALGIPAAFSSGYGSTMARAGAYGSYGSRPMQLVVSGTGDDLVKAIVKSLRYEIRTNGGGNVQQHLGWGSA